MSEIITASNIDLVIQKNKEIKEEVLAQALKLQMNSSIMKVSSIPQLATTILQGFGLIQLPIEDKYWSGAIFIKEGKLIPVINTALPRANQYFTAWHEIYHILFDNVSFDHIIENDNMLEERKAEYFAACMLLQSVDRYFKTLPSMDFLSKILYCMSAFQAPYKAVLISLYEDAVLSNNEKMMYQIKELIDCTLENIPESFRKLGLDDSLVLPSFVINTSYLHDKISLCEQTNSELKYHKENEEFLNNIVSELKLITKENDRI